ncbi:hypothetical protein Tco_0867197, partial [Tanacetum coccineum]
MEQIDDLDIKEMDINWQIAMISIQMKKECTTNATHDGKKKKDSLYQHQEAGKQEKNQMGLLTMDDGIVNWGEHTEVLKKQIILIDSGMSSNSKVGLGFEIKSNNEVLSYEEEMNFSVFKCSKEDSIGKPSYINTGRLDHDDSLMPELKIFHKPETGIFDEASYDEEGVITDFNSLPTEIEVSPTPTLRIHSIHPKSQILGDPKSAVQTRSKVQNKSGAHALLSHIQKQQRNNHKDQ